MTLDGGMIDDGILICPWHGFKFEATSGECISAPGAHSNRCRHASTTVMSGSVPVALEAPIEARASVTLTSRLSTGWSAPKPADPSVDFRGGATPAVWLGAPAPGGLGLPDAMPTSAQLYAPRECGSTTTCSSLRTPGITVY